MKSNRVQAKKILIKMMLMSFLLNSSLYSDYSRGLIKKIKAQQQYKKLSLLKRK